MSTTVDFATMFGRMTLNRASQHSNAAVIAAAVENRLNDATLAPLAGKKIDYKVVAINPANIGGGVGFCVFMDSPRFQNKTPYVTFVGLPAGAPAMRTVQAPNPNGGGNTSVEIPYTAQDALLRDGRIMQSITNFAAGASPFPGKTPLATNMRAIPSPALPSTSGDALLSDPKFMALMQLVDEGLKRVELLALRADGAMPITVANLAAAGAKLNVQLSLISDRDLDPAGLGVPISADCKITVSAQTGDGNDSHIQPLGTLYGFMTPQYILDPSTINAHGGNQAVQPKSWKAVFRVTHVHCELTSTPHTVWLLLAALPLLNTNDVWRALFINGANPNTPTGRARCIETLLPLTHPGFGQGQYDPVNGVWQVLSPGASVEQAFFTPETRASQVLQFTNTAFAPGLEVDMSVSATGVYSSANAELLGLLKSTDQSAAWRVLHETFGPSILGLNGDAYMAAGEAEKDQLVQNALATASRAPLAVTHTDQHNHVVATGLWPNGATYSMDRMTSVFGLMAATYFAPASTWSALTPFYRTVMPREQAMSSQMQVIGELYPDVQVTVHGDCVTARLNNAVLNAASAAMCSALQVKWSIPNDVQAALGSGITHTLAGGSFTSQVAMGTAYTTAGTTMTSGGSYLL